MAPPDDLTAPWASTPSEVTAALAVDAEQGLASDEVARRQAQFGPNALAAAPTRSALSIFVAQFKSLLVALLAAAAVGSAIGGHFVEAAAVALVLALNGVLGFVIELRATRSMEALQRLGTTLTTVRRDDTQLQVPAPALVPGDIVLLEAGEIVSADLRVLAASKLEVDESTFTGESVPVAKATDAVAESARLADRTCVLFKGTAITRGSATAVVVATGEQTEIGRISELVQQDADDTTPLERRLQTLGRGFVWVTLVLCVLVFVSGLLAGNDLYTLLQTVVALAVATVPEGLPVIATIALARGVRRMAAKNAVVRRLSAVETLGATSVLCTDKTGTLTENKMTVREVVGAGATWTLDDTGEVPHFVGPTDEGSDALRPLLEVAALCNNASVRGEEALSGDPMEVALLVAAARGGVDVDGLKDQRPEEREVAFDTESRMMATVHRLDEADAGGEALFAVKGAPEAVLAACALDDDERATWGTRAEAMASRGLRVLGLAHKRAPASEEAYRDLRLLGLVGLMDPPRPDVPGAIAASLDAGLSVVMITGDHPQTAVAIGREVGVARGDEQPHLGEEVQRGAPRLVDDHVFARVSPEEKLVLIEAHQQAGNIVAMLGDGVNDAPALRRADIGVAMGERGTEVARQAADLVLKDDRLGTVLDAIHEGRVIFDNLRTFVVYLLSCNVSEVLIVGIAAVLGAPLPFTALQILFLNLVTDVFPALALGVGEGDPGIMRRRPRPKREEILNRPQWLAIGVYGAVLTAAGLAAFWIALGPLALDEGQARAVVFVTVGLGQTLHALNLRSGSSPALKNEITSNPWVWGALALSTGLVLSAVVVPGAAEVLGAGSLTPDAWALAVGLAAAPLLVGQALLSLKLIDHTR